MGHLIPMAFNSILIILIGHYHPWASMAKNVTIIVSLKVKKVKLDSNCVEEGGSLADPWVSMGKNVTVIVEPLTSK